MAPSLWLTLIIAGLLTFATRLSFFVLLGRWQPPKWFQRALRFVPTAVLSAIIVPEVLMSETGVNLSPLNPRLLAALIAGLVAWKTKNATLTVLAGMIIFWIVSGLMG